MAGIDRLYVDIIGWVGAIALLGAYGLISTRRIAGDSAPYQILNLFGAICLIINTFYYGAFPSTVVNLAWIAIAMYSLLRLARHRP